MSVLQVEQELPLTNERWVRMPPPGGRLRGLSRVTIDRLVRPQELNGYKAPVESRVLCISGGKRRGVRLIDVHSLDTYIESQSSTSIEPWARAPKKPTKPKTRRRKPTKSKP